MKLRKKLEDLQNNHKEVKFLKIGSGTSFWYCAALDENIYSTIEEISKNYHKKYKTDLSRFKAKYPHCKKDEKENLALKIERTANYLEHWKDLLDRNVQDFYKGISYDEPCTWIIICEGQEGGDYWTLKEYMNQK